MVKSITLKELKERRQSLKKVRASEDKKFDKDAALLSEARHRLAESSTKPSDSPQSFNWCGDLSPPCPIGRNSKCKEMTEHAINGDHMTVAEDYDVPEIDLYQHLMGEHYAPSPNEVADAERRHQAHEEFFDGLEEMEDEGELLFKINKLFVRELVAKFRDADPNQAARMMKEVRENILARKRLRESPAGVTITNNTINQINVHKAQLEQIWGAINKVLSPAQKQLLLAEIPSIKSDIGERTDEIMGLKPLTDLTYVVELQTEHQDDLGY